MKSRKSFIAANWKMHKTVEEAVSFVDGLQREVGPQGQDREVVIAPPYTALNAVRAAMKQQGFKLSAQNCHWEDKGAFTGEVSCGMIRGVGCEHVIVGHSERRHLFGETDDMIRKKVAAAFRSGLVPILCVGEVLEEREKGKTFDVVGAQLERAVEGLSGTDAERLVIAYEPVWAIGTGKNATPEQAQEVHAFLREKYGSHFDKDVANKIRIVYGGSVKPDNVDTLMARADIDGLLVGGASLEVDSFKRIVLYQIQ